jgi:hypothetical protein
MRFYSINSGGGRTRPARTQPTTNPEPVRVVHHARPALTISQQLLHFDGTFLHNVLGESAAMMMAMFDGIKCIIIWTPLMLMRPLPISSSQRTH